LFTFKYAGSWRAAPLSGRAVRRRYNIVISDDPKAACEYLERLAQAAPTPETMADVLAALDHKREGVQVCAGRTLTRWNDTSAVPALRHWLHSSLKRKHGHSCVSQAAYCLARFVEAEDVHWILDLYFGKTNSLQKSCLRPLVAVLPSSQVRERIMNELRSDKAANREAAVRAAYALSFGDISEMLLPLQGDRSPTVRNLAVAIRASASKRAV
jgi:hypothetical protein